MNKVANGYACEGEIVEYTRVGKSPTWKKSKDVEAQTHRLKLINYINSSIKSFPRCYLPNTTRVYD